MRRFQIVTWKRVWLLAQLYLVVAVVILLWPVSLYAGLLIAFGKLTHRGYKHFTTLGSARWADAKDLRQAGMLGAKSGLILGRMIPERRVPRLLAGRAPSENELVRLPQTVHTAVFAPTGVGKGVSLVIPSLLTDDRSAVVIDFKGEIAKLTAEHRRKEFGHRTAFVDPYGVYTQKPDSLNPFASIRADSPYAINDCNDFSESTVIRTGRETEMHWNDSAVASIAAVAATVIGYGDRDNRSPSTVREILSHTPKLELATKLMIESDRWGGALASMGGQLLHFAEKERASVLSTALRHLRFLGTPAIADSVRTSTFDPAELRTGRMTVYLILPPDRARANAGLLRMWVATLLRASMRGGLQ